MNSDKLAEAIGLKCARCGIVVRETAPFLGPILWYCPQCYVVYFYPSEVTSRWLKGARLTHESEEPQDGD